MVKPRGMSTEEWRALERVRSAARYAAHREEKRAQRRAYHAAHREEKRAYNQIYRVVHREEARVADAARYVANRERRIAHSRAYYAAHREEYRAREAARISIFGEDVDFHKAPDEIRALAVAVKEARKALRQRGTAA